MDELYFYIGIIAVSSTILASLIFLFKGIKNNWNKMDLHDNDTLTDKP